MMNTTSHSIPDADAASVDDLVRLIHAAASGEVTPEAFAVQMQAVHEAVEAADRAHYASPEQARLIWDVLWALTFYDPDAPGEESTLPLESVMTTVRRVARRLGELPG